MIDLNNTPAESHYKQLEKAPTGIVGLDEITGGGSAQRSSDPGYRKRGLRKDPPVHAVPRAGRSAVQ